jgi:hypothetical protein
MTGICKALLNPVSFPWQRFLLPCGAAILSPAIVPIAQSPWSPDDR